MELVIIALAFWGICEAIKAGIRKSQEKARQEQMERIKHEQEAQRAMLIKAQYDERERARQMALLEREQIRQAKEQKRMQKEQDRQAKQIAKHDEMLMKLDIRLASAENEIAFNREQRERLFKVLKAEQEKQRETQKDSDAWMKHERKIIALENQIHTAQKKIDKAQADKYFCKQKMSA